MKVPNRFTSKIVYSLIIAFAVGILAIGHYQSNFQNVPVVTKTDLKTSSPFVVSKISQPKLKVDPEAKRKLLTQEKIFGVSDREVK